MRLGLRQLLLRLLLDEVDLFSLPGYFLRLNFGLSFVLLRVDLVVCDQIVLLLRVFSLFVQSRPKFGQSHLQFSDLLCGPG